MSRTRTITQERYVDGRVVETRQIEYTVSDRELRQERIIAAIDGLRADIETMTQSLDTYRTTTTAANLGRLQVAQNDAVVTLARMVHRLVRQVLNDTEPDEE